MYQPKEDSFFLSETLENFFKHKNTRNKSFLDMGSGSGIQAETLAKFAAKKNIVCVDIDKEVIKFLKARGFHAIHSNLFSKIKGKFDYIIFNPPYLPEHRYDKEKDTTGGKKGDETILRFLRQAKKHLNKDGKIFLLLSSHTPHKRINNYLTENYKFRKIADKKLFFETLEVWLISLKYCRA
jgi:release factor glutamine methyltransferase